MIQKNVLEYLEHSAAEFPEKIAFADEKQAVTFAGMRASAQALGTAVMAKTQRYKAPIVVLTERTAATLTAFMGVLYSGNYYVPLDSKMPIPRMKSILDTVMPAAILYPADTEKTVQQLEADCPLLCEEEAFAYPVDADALDRRRSRILDIDPVYIIFTSGSTGKPKGIVISHRSVIDFTEWMAEAGRFSSQDVLGNQAPFYFDLSVKDIYLTLKCGATTHIIPKKLFMFPLLLVRFLEEKKVTALVWATSAFHLVANSGALKKEVPTHLRTVILGGEALQAKQLNQWRAALPEVRYINLYGPTEVTVDCTWYPIVREFSDSEIIPIGRACANKEVFLLDENLQPVPVGQPGEICVRGIGLAKGYFHEPEKTQNVFIPDPRNPYYPDMIYRTGDIAVMDEEGVLTFLSRQDGQIKHMGYRIELGEIETALNSIEGVAETICCFDRKHDKIVCIYSGDSEERTLAKAVRTLLPRYMLPNVYHHLEAMPHNANGKIDRVKLKEQYIGETD